MNPSFAAMMAGVLLTCAVVAPAAFSQVFPSKPLRIVVPYEPGTTPDRFLAHYLRDIATFVQIVRDARIARQD